MDRERVLPEGVIDADPASGWDGVDDIETREQDAAAAGSPELTDAGSRANAQDDPETLAPDGPVESDPPSRGVDPDFATEEGS